PGGRDCVAVKLDQLGFHLVVAEAEWRTPAAVDPVKFVFLRAVNDGEKIAADSVRDRLHQTQRCIRGDGSVDSAAAALQNINPNLRRRRHAGANHSVPGEYL